MFEIQKRFVLAGLMFLVVFGSQTFGQIQIAETLLVDLTATGFDPESGVWTPRPSCVDCLGDFLSEGSPQRITTAEGVDAISFNGTTDFFTSDFFTPAGLVGLDPTRSIEVWVLNPFIDAEETLLAWGHRGGPDGSNMSFNYGSNPMYGAVGHWGSPDKGWNNDDTTGGAPERGLWHHLAYTFNGTTTSVYADGILVGEEIIGAGLINTYALDDASNPLPIRIASQTDASGIATGGLRGSLMIGGIRVHDGALEDFEVLTNYLLEKDNYPSPGSTITMPEPIPKGPIHRYPFTGEGADALLVIDYVGNAHGTIVDAGNTPNFTFSNGVMDLSANTGEPSNGITEDAYVDLPNGIISAAADSGGGAITLEWWASVAETHTWQRFGDFGTSNNGEDTSDNGNASGYILVTPNSGRFADGLEATNHPASNAAEPSAGKTGPFPIDTESHVVAVYDHNDDSAGANGTMTLYLDGELIGANQIHPDFNLTELDDNNNWLGRSQWADPTFDGSYNEFRIYDIALTHNQVLGNFEAGPDTINVVAGIACDFDKSGVCDTVDLDELLYTGLPSGNTKYDLDNSGTVDLADRDEFLSQLGTVPGDFDLDGKVVASDLNILGGNWTATVTSYGDGDANGDGLVNATDLNAIGNNWQFGNGAAAPLASTVPEPSGCGYMLALLAVLGSLTRRRKV